METELKPSRPALTFQEELFLFCSLMLVTCFFLPWGDHQSPSDSLSSDLTAAPFLWLLLTVLCLAPLTVRFPRARPWVGLWTVLGITGTLADTPRAYEYGAQLARFFALGMLVLSANPVVVRASEYVMKRLNSQKAEESSHWGTALRSLQFSTQEFYAKLEQSIVARAWPGVEILRVLHHESGVLSHKREYLRVVRQRQVFDICAASFGNDYFFTLREAEMKPALSLTTLLIFLLSLTLILNWSVNLLGLIPGFIGFFVVLLLGFYLMWNAVRLGLTRLDGMLVRLPVLGPVYEACLRRSTTYFQHDTRMVFLKLMDDLVKEHVDEETSAKGIKLLSCFERQPIFEGFYKIKERPTDGEGRGTK